MLYVRVFFSVLHIKKERNYKVYQSDRQRVENNFWREYVGSYLGTVLLHFNSWRNLEGVARSNLVKRKAVLFYRYYSSLLLHQLMRALPDSCLQAKAAPEEQTVVFV